MANEPTSKAARELAMLLLWPTAILQYEHLNAEYKRRADETAQRIQAAVKDLVEKAQTLSDGYIEGYSDDDQSIDHGCPQCKMQSDDLREFVAPWLPDGQEGQ